MVVIRLARGGAKKSPFYHLVVTNSRNARDGRYIERLGFYNPMARGKATSLELNQERLSHWVTNGAILSERVGYLVRQYEKVKSNPNHLADEKAKKIAKNQAKKEKLAQTKAAEEQQKAAAEEPANESEAKE